MSDLDMASFKMTRLSDVIVIGKGASDGILASSNSEIDETKLAELENLIKQMKQNWVVDTKEEMTLKRSNLLKEKSEPLEDSIAKSKKPNTNRKFTIVIKYTRDKLLLLASSAICRMPPPCWEEVAKKLPTVLIKHVDSTVSLKTPQRVEYINSERSIKFPKRSGLHGDNPPIQEANDPTKGGINDAKKPNSDNENQTELPENKDRIGLKHTNGEILKAGKKSSTIDYLMFTQLKKNPPLQSNLKLENESKLLAKHEENGCCLKDSLSLLCSICKELCKRGVSMPCCDAKACRYCAVKNLTNYVTNVNRKCWSCSQGPVDTKDLVVDDILRDAVQEFIKT